jgi:hypothetical protein
VRIFSAQVPNPAQTGNGSGKDEKSADDLSSSHPNEKGFFIAPIERTTS